MKKLRIAAWIGFALVAGAIFYLTTQTPEATISASHWATEHLPRFLIEPKWPDGSVLLTAQTNGAYLSVLRAGALRFPGHAGLCAVLPDGTGLGGDGHRLVCSLADQTHKLFIPGREFDGRDLVLDAVGYAAAGFLVFFYPVDHSEKAAEIVRKDRFRRIQKSVKKPRCPMDAGVLCGDARQAFFTTGTQISMRTSGLVPSSSK